MTDELRAKFEVWATIERRSNLERDPLHKEEYNYRSTDTAWKAWQAAHASRDAEVEALKRDADAFKNFHRLLCQRFDYVHDEKDWRRDQLSLIEHIVKSKYTANGELQYFVDGLGWVVRCQDFWKYLQVRAEELKIIDAAMAKESQK